MAYNSTTNNNYSNSSARSPDAKEPAPQNTTADLVSSPYGVEWGPTIINRRDAENQQDAAIEAERQWLKEVSSDPSHPVRNNKIRLISTLVDNGTLDGRVNTGIESITFELSPDISESKQVIYAEIGDVREAASMMVYGGSPSRKWSINAKFLSRSPEEADQTWRYVQLLRSWTLPDKNYKYGLDRSIPRVVRLHGYGRTWQGIPVVLTGLNIDYPSDVDYIPATGNVTASPTEENVDTTPYEHSSLVPVIQSVSFQLTEIRTPKELFKDYNLEKFKLGVLPNW